MSVECVSGTALSAAKIACATWLQLLYISCSCCTSVAWCAAASVLRGTRLSGQLKPQRVALHVNMLIALYKTYDQRVYKLMWMMQSAVSQTILNRGLQAADQQAADVS